ncbi:hypothetical protein [Candidatus Magnetominusculus xianensis]|uniref:hypothetical protein n=1 Tax=Candidatus Magnetominusculus xianensis TaxID=1748249 RepID=UPI0012EE82DB|nr:hypothetical protein [Candidatus Magnetominusculus xianensis]MBF0403622.1 hypothetical protein [Nitrospirota bacterium]
MKDSVDARINTKYRVEFELYGMIKLRIPNKVVLLNAKINRKFIETNADSPLSRKNLDSLYSIRLTLNVITMPRNTTV